MTARPPNRRPSRAAGATWPAPHASPSRPRSPSPPLGVPAPLVAALAERASPRPSPSRPPPSRTPSLACDILGRGQTGSGKTLGFSIPLAARLADGYTSACRPRGLVLVPTRELASQVQASSAAGPGGRPERRDDLRRRPAEPAGGGPARPC